MADFNSKYTGEEVEQFLDQIANGDIGGGGGIVVETDPIFSASPAASITEAKKTEWDAKYTKPSGGIPASDLASDVFLQGEQGPKGDDGVGIASVVQTTTSSADSGSNVMTVTLSDGTKSTFTVKNGSKGSQGEQGPKGDQGIQGVQGPKGDTGAEGPKGDKGDTGPEGPKGDKGDKGDTGATGANGTNGKDGADGEDGATFTPSVDANGNLSWTNNKGLSNPPTVNIKGPKGDSGEGGGSSGGKEIVEVIVDSGSITFSGMGSRPSFEPNKIYYATTPVLESVGIFSVIPPTEDIGEYSLHFSYANPGFPYFEAPSDWLWPNGIPTVEEGVSYELSVVATKLGSDYIYKAVLTPFKEV